MEVPMSKQELNTAAIVEFARSTYASAKMRTDVLVFTHCVSTARLAEQIAHKLFADMRGDLVPQDVNDIIAAIVNSALLAETINTQRVDFETVVDVANVQIASMVATLSRDLRLVETKRDIEYRGRLSQSPVATQIVAVAAIVCTAQEVVDLLKQNNLAVIPKARKILAQLDADLLSIHAASRYYVLRLYTHAARNLIGDANQIIKKIRGDAKMARAIEKHTATLRSKVAAKAAVREPKQQKEKQDGKKRASRESV
jgi:hypothetical protein